MPLRRARLDPGLFFDAETGRSAFDTPPPVARTPLQFGAATAPAPSPAFPSSSVPTAFRAPAGGLPPQTFAPLPPTALPRATNGLRGGTPPSARRSPVRPPEQPGHPP